jgi:hypothetical protein
VLHMATRQRPQFRPSWPVQPKGRNGSKSPWLAKFGAGNAIDFTGRYRALVGKFGRDRSRHRSDQRRAARRFSFAPPAFIVLVAEITNKRQRSLLAACPVAHLIFTRAGAIRRVSTPSRNSLKLQAISAHKRPVSRASPCARLEGEVGSLEQQVNYRTGCGRVLVAASLSANDPQLKSSSPALRLESGPATGPYHYSFSPRYFWMMRSNCTGL